MTGEMWQPGYSGYNPGEGVLSEETRPWNFLDIAKDIFPENANVLDVGCGNGKKLQELLTTYGLKVSFTGFDLNSELLTKTKQRFEESGLDIGLARANSTKGFPFPNETFDVVTFMLSTHNAKEAYRVLKPGGFVLMERVGDEDKKDIKVMFGDDVSGKPRGFKLSKEPGKTLDQYTQDFKDAGFETVMPYSGTWKSYHSEEGLRYLLEHTPFVADYDHVKDRETFDAVVRRFFTPQGIEIVQHRILVIAMK